MILPKIFTKSHTPYFSFLKTSKGFTLIELLIVIAMIVILISVGFASFTRAQKNARDTQRKQDLNQVKTALEQFFADNLYYPGATGGGGLSCDPPGRTIGWSGLQPFECHNSAGVDTIYMRVFPKDPSGPVGKYCYIVDTSPPATTATSFKLYALMENTKNANISPVTISTCTNGQHDKNYLLESEK